MDIDEVVFVVHEEREVGGYSAACHRFGIFTQGDTLEDLHVMVRDAVACRFEGESTKPTHIRLHFVRDEIIAA